MKTSIKDLNLLKWALPFSQLHFLAPVSILIFLSKGFSLEEITIAFTTLIFALYIVFEVPSGFFADKYGRKTSLVLAQILSICSLLLFIFAPSFEWLLIGSVIGGLSGSLFSGADSAILYDTSLVLGKEKEYEDILGVAKKREYIIYAITSIMGGFLFTLDVHYPLIGTVMTATTSLVLFTLVKEPTLHKSNSIKFTDFKFVFSKQKIWWLASYSAGIFGFAMMIHRSFMQLYLEPLLAVSLLGFLFAGFRFVQAFAAKYARIIKDAVGYKLALLLPITVTGLSFVFVQNNILQIAFSFVLYFALGISVVLINNLIQKEIPLKSELLQIQLSVFFYEVFRG